MEPQHIDQQLKLNNLLVKWSSHRFNFSHQFAQHPDELQLPDKLQPPDDNTMVETLLCQLRDAIRFTFMDTLDRPRPQNQDLLFDNDEKPEIFSFTRTDYMKHS
ncbi:unnamed protein product [Schistocephalus solidus]|uniref:Uncharacterized protein n=1 Tax=Schistocephalus solidus TaxID=70667 RepID=A0A183TGH4_SCHSO|nr:unnamed protein product [Schistocephalus solidus]